MPFDNIHLHDIGIFIFPEIYRVMKMNACVGRSIVLKNVEYSGYLENR